MDRSRGGGSSLRYVLIMVGPRVRWSPLTLCCHQQVGGSCWLLVEMIDALLLLEEIWVLFNFQLKIS